MKYTDIKEFKNQNEHLSYLEKEKIIHNIETVLNCSIEDTDDYSILTGGYTNPVFTFSLEGKTYVYRYPGLGSDSFINRVSEYKAHRIAKDLGLDDSLIWISEDGHKISHFISDYRYFDYKKQDDVEMVVKMMRSLHNSETLTGIKYDIHAEIQNFYDTNRDYNKSIYADIEEIYEIVEKIYHDLGYENATLSLCHNDIYTTNILITDEKVFLIDWEFGKDTHPALDLATFFVCSPYTVDEIEEILKRYLQSDREEDLLEYYKYFVVGGFYWLLWSLHVEKNGGDTEGFVQNYYKYLKMFLKRIGK